MKQITQVNNSKGLISRFLGLKSRITSTKPVLTMLALLMVALFGVNESAWGACNYTLNDAVLSKSHEHYRTIIVKLYKINDFVIGNVDNTYGISHIKVSGEFSGFTSGTANQTFTLQYKIDNGAWQTPGSGVNIGKHKKGAAYTTIYDGDVNIAANAGDKVYFKLSCANPGTDFTDTKYPLVLSVEIRMATTASMPSALNIGNVAVDGSEDGEMNFTHSNRNGQTITFSSSQSAFVVSPSSVTLGCSGSEKITVTYKPTCGNKPTSAIITAKYGNTTLYSSEVTATPTLRSQTVNWELGNATSLVAGSSLDVAGFATSTSDIDGKPAIYYTSSDPTVISVASDGHTLVANDKKAGYSATITAHQDADCKYGEATADQVFTVTAKDRPEFTLYVGGVATEATSANLKVGDVVEIHYANAPNLQVSGGSSTTFTHSKNTTSKIVTITAQGVCTNGELTLYESGNTYVEAREATFTFNISKHETELSSLLDVNNFYVGNSVYAATEYNFANNAAYTTNNSEVPVQFSSTDENVINVANGKIKALKAGKATVTISQAANNKWTGASVEQTITVNKHAATFGWNVGSAYTWNQSISNPFTTDNHDTQITCVSDDTNVADYVDGKVVIYNVTGTAHFTLHQDSSDVWAETSQQYTVNVTKVNKHVPFTINQALYNTLKDDSKSSGDRAWDSGIKIGDSGAGGTFNWDEKYVVIGPFEGVPDKLSCTYSCSDASSGRKWKIFQSANGVNWSSKVVLDESSKGTLTNGELEPSTRYLKFFWSGNYAGYFDNISITERREVKPHGSADVDCGTANHGSDPTEVTAILEWYNVKPLTCWITSDHPEAFELVTTSINSRLDTCKKNEEIVVRGKHDVPAGTYTGTLHVSNGIESTTFNLTTTTTKQTPVITWKNDLSPLSVGDIVPDAASAGSATIKYTVDGTYLRLNEDGAVVAENATGEEGVDLIAYVEEDETWKAASETIKVVVTNLQKQTITWTDKLSFKFTGTKVIDLTATSSSGVEITYELSGTGNYATLDNANKKLTVTGIGSSLYLTAKTVDNAEYYPAARTKTINSRDPNASCASHVLYEDKEEKTLHTIDWEEISWDLEEGAPGVISFSIKRMIAAAGNMALEEWYDKDWHRVETYSVSTTYATKTETLSRKATKARIGAPVGATLQHYVDDIVLYQAKYCELSETELDFGTVTMGTAPTMSFTVHYSNLEKSLDIELENENTQFSVDKTYIGDDCGEHGTVTVTVTYNAANYVESESTNLIISNTEYNKKVSLKALIKKASQTITWNPASLDLKTTDDVTFDAVTTDAAAATGIVVTYAVKGTSDVATVTSDGHLTILKDGSVTIVASAEGNSQYEDATPVEKTFTISKVTPTITNNPTISSITLPATLADVTIGMDGTAKDDKNTVVTGTFAWQTSGTKVLSEANDYTIVFTPDQPAGKDWYNTKTYDISVTGIKDSQEITWTRADETTQPCSTPTTFDASSNRGLTISYSSSDESIARVEKVGEEYRLVVLTSGTVHITAKQLGNGDYNAAEDVTKTITLTKEQPVIVTPPTADEIFTDNLLNEAGLSGGEGQVNGVHAEGIFAWKNGDIQPEFGTHTYTATFTPSPAAWYYPAECQVSVTVNKHPHSLSWAYAGGTIYVDKDDLYFSGATSSVELDNIYYTTSNAEIAEVDKTDGNKLIIHGKGTIDIIARSEGNTIYDAAEQRRSLTILPLATTVVAGPAATDITYGDALSESDLTGGTVKGSDNVELVGTWTWNDGTEELNAGQGQSRGVTFTPTLSNWYATVSTTVEINVIAAIPVATPSAANIVYGQKVNESVLSNEGTAGTWSWTDEKAEDVLAAGTYNDLAVHFTPASGNYTELDATVSLTVEKATPEVTAQASAITYGQVISASELSTASGEVSGTWAWAVDEEQVLSVGDHVLKANFTSTNANYNDLSNVDVTLTVNKIEELEVPVALSFCAGGEVTFHDNTYTEAGEYHIEAEGATRDTVYNVTVTKLQPTTGTDSKTITVGASESWNGIDLSIYAVGSHEVVFHTENVAGCDSTVTLSLTVVPATNIFTNTAENGDWGDPANWSNGVPSGSEPNVIINGDLIIDSEVTVGNLTIEKNSRVVLTVNGDLTVNGTSESREEYGNLYVENGGEVEVNGDLKVGDLTVEASIGTANGTAESGQVDKAENIVYANAYIEINMDPSGVVDGNKWYGFTVPFEVNARNGISRKVENSYQNCNYGTDYIIAEYDAAKRLSSGKGWKYLSGNTLNAGQFYYFGGDGGYNTYRFKASGNIYTPVAEKILSMNGTGADANWNAVGNSTLQHAKVSFEGGNYVQVYQNGLDAYKTVATSEATFVVGCPFFIQASENATLALSVPTDASEKYYAPRRSNATQDGVARVNLTSVDGGYSDQIYVSGTEKENDEYVLGHDLSKAGLGTAIPQLWVDAYGQKLSVHEAVWQGENALCQLGIYAPKEGEYLLTATQPENGTQVYLTIDGMPVWNISEADYVLSLEKGTMNNYGLMLIQASRMPTDVENVEAADGENTQKIILNDHLYILRDSRMYDATGKKVK